MTQFLLFFQKLLKHISVLPFLSHGTTGLYIFLDSFSDTFLNARLKNSGVMRFQAAIMGIDDMRRFCGPSQWIAILVSMYLRHTAHLP